MPSRRPMKSPKACARESALTVYRDPYQNVFGRVQGSLDSYPGHFPDPAGRENRWQTAARTFIVTLPKVTTPTQVSTCAKILENLEARLGFAEGFAAHGNHDRNHAVDHQLPGRENTVPLLVAAAGGRCRSAIFGTYDYTASCNITAAHQSHTHPACDFARHVLQVSLAGTGITISDGATTSMPIGPHKASQGRSVLSASADGRESRRRACCLEAALR
jgi:hypothetical protein